MMIVLALTQCSAGNDHVNVASADERISRTPKWCSINPRYVDPDRVLAGWVLSASFCARRIVDWLSADRATADWQKPYLLLFLPGLLLQFPLVALVSAAPPPCIIKPAVGSRCSCVSQHRACSFADFRNRSVAKARSDGAALATFIRILIARCCDDNLFEKKYHYVRFDFPSFGRKPKSGNACWGSVSLRARNFCCSFVYIVLVYANHPRLLDQRLRQVSGIGARSDAGALFARSVALSGRLGHFGKSRDRRDRRSTISVYIGRCDWHHHEWCRQCHDRVESVTDCLARDRATAAEVLSTRRNSKAKRHYGQKERCITRAPISETC